MKSPLKRAVVLATAAALATPLSAYATNGMFVIGYGANSRAMGGVAIATPQDSLVGATNPAGIAALKGTMQMNVSAAIFAPHANAQLDGMSQRSVANLYIMPAMGMAMAFTPKLTVGFSMVGVGGGGSHYMKNLYGKAVSNAPNSELGVSLMIMQANPTVAFKFNRHNAFGMSLVLGLQQFRAFGLSQYFATFTNLPSGQTATKMSNNGNDYAYGAGLRLGWLGTYWGGRVRLGAEATSKVYMTKFRNYTQLFANHGRFDTPANLGVGVSFKPIRSVTVGMDITRIFYSGVAAVSNPGPNVTGTPFPVSKTVNGLGADQGLGFGWQNQTVYKLGLAYRYNSRWTVRAGWNYAKSPINESRDILFNIVAPATVENHATLGFSYSPNPTMEYSVAYVHAFKFTQYGPTYFDATKAAQISMDQNALGFEFALKM